MEWKSLEKSTNDIVNNKIKYVQTEMQKTCFEYDLTIEEKEMIKKQQKRLISCKSFSVKV